MSLVSSKRIGRFTIVSVEELDTMPVSARLRLTLVHPPLLHDLVQVLIYQCKWKKHVEQVLLLWNG